MHYPQIPDFRRLAERLSHYAQLKHERGAQGITEQLAQAQKAMEASVAALEGLAEDPELATHEPDALEKIRKLRPQGPRRLDRPIDPEGYRNRLAGALLARCAGCTLGAPVELWPIEKMEALARELEEPFPPVNYWRRVPDPFTVRYGGSPRKAYTRGHIDGVPVDDDITYTLLGLLIAEHSGLDFTTEQVGEAWLRWLPHAMTAEAIALENLRHGVPAEKAATTDNPYCDWIGADIRADPWGYLAPGWPERAAAMAWNDARISHRRQGVYGAMFFAAAIAAAFIVDDPMDAIRIGLTEIPEQCGLAKAIRWALERAPEVTDYRAAREAVDQKFPGMHPVHTTNNACLTVFGLAIGQRDVTRVLGETVAMGLDNDCTAATAGSIVGAVVGRDAVPTEWTRSFGDTIHTYLNQHSHFSIEDVVNRFDKLRAR